MGKSHDIETIFRKKHGVFLKHLKIGRSPNIETIFRKAKSFSKNKLRWVGHLILRPFLEKKNMSFSKK